MAIKRLFWCLSGSLIIVRQIAGKALKLTGCELAAHITIIAILEHRTRRYNDIAN